MHVRDGLFGRVVLKFVRAPTLSAYPGTMLGTQVTAQFEFHATISGLTVAANPGKPLVLQTT